MVLRGIEQLPFKIIAAKLVANEATLRWRFQRVLERLRGSFPDQMVKEMEEEA